MKTIVLSVLVFFVAVKLSDAAEKREFPGVQKAMPRSEYEAAGLEKLSPEERARLDAYIRQRVSSTNKRAAEEAAAEAVDRAVQETSGQAPRVIESRIIGRFNGYSGHTTFNLENGQRWTQCQPESRNYPMVDNPRVTIVKGMISYHMFIVGGGAIRVQLVRVWPNGRRSYY